jgi:hypothetical protein
MVYRDGEPFFGSSIKTPYQITVGWLRQHESFTRSPALPAVLASVDALESVPLTMGFQECPFCAVKSASALLFAVGPTAVYVAPALLRHFMADHQYQPPAWFIEVLLHGLDAPVPAGQTRRWFHLTPSQIAAAYRTPALVDDPRYDPNAASINLYDLFNESLFGSRSAERMIKLLQDSAYVTRGELLLPDTNGLMAEKQAWEAFRRETRARR